MVVGKYFQLQFRHHHFWLVIAYPAYLIASSVLCFLAVVSHILDISNFLHVDGGSGLLDVVADVPHGTVGSVQAITVVTTAATILIGTPHLSRSIWVIRRVGRVAAQVNVRMAARLYMAGLQVTATAIVVWTHAQSHSLAIHTPIPIRINICA